MQNATKAACILVNSWTSLALKKPAAKTAIQLDVVSAWKAITQIVVRHLWSIFANNSQISSSHIRTVRITHLIRNYTHSRPPTMHWFRTARVHLNSCNRLFWISFCRIDNKSFKVSCKAQTRSLKRRATYKDFASESSIILKSKRKRKSQRKTKSKDS